MNPYRTYQQQAQSAWLRIDLLLATQPIVARVTAVGIDREERKGKLPSDHAPVWVELS